MADVVFSAKMNQETRDRLTKLVERSGMRTKDFLAQMVMHYEINQIRNVGPVKELDELHRHLYKIEDICVRLVRSRNGEATVSEGSAQVAELQATVKRLKRERNELASQLAAHTSEFEKYGLEEW